MPSEIPEPWSDWESLIAAVLNENAAAVLAFAEWVGFRARAILLGKGLSQADAEGLAATCVTEIFWELPKFRGGNFSAWTHVLVVHELCDELRRRGRSVEAHADAALEQRSNGSSPTRRATARVRGAVATALATLADDERLIVELRFGGEPIAFREIAAALGKSEEAVRVRSHRARAKLERLLRDDPRLARLLARWDALSEPQKHQPGQIYAKP